jgi:hypothetical protein
VRKLLQVTGVLGMLAAVACAGASADVTGNPASIAFAKQVTEAYTHVATVSFRETGLLSIQEVNGYQGFSFDWGDVPAGFQAVSEQGTFELKAGNLVWVTDLMTPPACTLLCEQLPVRVVADAKGTYWEDGAVQCYGEVPGPTPWGFGASFWAVNGDYGPLIRHGDTVLQTYSYRWDSASQTATETDTISARTHLVTASHIVVSAGPGPNQSALDITSSYHYSGHRAQPAVPMCA